MTVGAQFAPVYLPDEDYTEDEDTETIDVNDDGVDVCGVVRNRLCRCRRG